MTTTPTIGFIGTGGIAEAIVRGLCAADDTPYQIVVSPLCEKRSAALAAEFPTRVRVAADNQDVINQSDWVFITVLPDIARQILPELRFQLHHNVVNVVASLGLAEVAEIIGPTAILVHMVPLPGCAKRLGPIVTYPPNLEVVRLFGPLGKVVSVEAKHEALVLQTITCLMGSYYTLLAEVLEWGVEKGLGEADVQAYIGSFFTSMSQQATMAEEGPQALALDQTPGGLNVQALQHLRNHDAFTPWLTAMDQVLAFVSK